MDERIGFGLYQSCGNMGSVERIVLDGYLHIFGESSVKSYLHLIDICFPTCICLWQISKIQARLFKVVGPGLVSTSPTFVSSSASYPLGPHDRHAKKNR